MTKPLVTQVLDQIASSAQAAARVRQAARDAADQAVADRQGEPAPAPTVEEDAQHG